MPIHKPFAKDALTTLDPNNTPSISKFGGLATSGANDPSIYTDETAAMQSLPAWDKGFAASLVPVQGKDGHTTADLNAFGKVISDIIRYQQEAGIHTWRSDVTYPMSALAEYNGDIMISNLEGNLNRNPAETTDWQNVFDGLSWQGLMPFATLRTHVPFPAPVWNNTYDFDITNLDNTFGDGEYSGTAMRGLPAGDYIYEKMPATVETWLAYSLDPNNPTIYKSTSGGNFVDTARAEDPLTFTEGGQYKTFQKGKMVHMIAGAVADGNGRAFFNFQSQFSPSSSYPTSNPTASGAIDPSWNRNSDQRTMGWALASSRTQFYTNNVTDDNAPCLAEVFYMID